MPNMYPGYQPVTDATIKKKFEYAWGQTLNENTGLALPEIFDGVYKNRIKALYIIGADPILANPDSLQIRDALDRVELLIYQSSFLGEVGQLADVVLPAATLIEKDGTFTNTERRVQRVRKVVESAGNAKPDWWITCQIAKRMGGRGFDYESPADIMVEIARLTPIYGGISYEHLEKGGLQWPCPSTDHPGTSVLHADVFTRGKGLFLPLRRGATREIAEDRYPLVLTAKRSLSDFLTGMKAREAPGVRTPTGLISVEISLLDALTLSIADGDKVKVISKQGDITALARVSSLAPLGVVSIDVLSLLATVNVMTDTARGIVAKIAEHTIFAVRIERK
jgi:predicted molibdopterin-dependent oxidoreductase YjgC